MFDIFEKILQFHHVPYNRKETQKLCLTHPFSSTLLGFAQLFEIYRFKYSVVCIKDKNNIWKLPTPFFADISGTAVLVWDVNKESITFDRKGKPYSLSISEFMKIWTGIVLVATKTETSSEPNFIQNHSLQRKQRAEICLGLLCFVTILFIPYLNNAELFSLQLVLSCLIHSIAIMICFLLFAQHIQIEQKGKFANICGKSSHSSCREFMSEHQIKYLGNYNLSELGIAFFLSNLLFTIVWPVYANVYIPITFLCALPFTLWSVWFQKWRIKKWCPFCLMIQTLVWMQCAIFMYFGCYKKDAIFQIFSWHSLCLFLPLSYFLLTIVFHKISELRRDARTSISLQHQLSQIKNQKTLFLYLLEAGKSIPSVTKITSLHFEKKIDKQKPVITVISNLFCNHCAMMHTRLQKLLSAGFPINYVFMGLKAEGREAARLFITNYKEYGPEDTWKKLSQWYVLTRNQKNESFRGAVIRFSPHTRRNANHPYR